MKTFGWAAFMRDHSILSSLDDRHVQWLLSDDASTERQFRPGEVIVREGEVGEPRSATVRARDTCVVLEIMADALRPLAEAHANLEFQVLLTVSERLRNKNEQILSLHLRGVQSANRAKDEFLAMLGHELRNPLAAISMAIHVLDKLGKPDDQAAPMREIIIRQSRHLARLLDDLLDVSKLVSGKARLHRRAEDLKQLVLRVLSSFDEIGRTTRHTVRLTGDTVMVHADPGRLEQVVSNLLDNALKYTPPGGHIHLTVAAETQDAVLRIRDTGIGIAADVLPRIFDLFVQANATIDRADGGLGLGLALVKRLVEMHGGTVSATSAGPNLGAEVTVRIPRPEAAMSARSSEPATFAGPARRILIIEDSRDVRHGLRVLLESWGHEVEEAAMGARGVEMLRRSTPEIALIDLGLPEMDGYAVAEAVRASPGGARVRLIAMTGYGQPHDERRARAAGFDAHLTKPLNPLVLARLIAER